MTAVPPTEAGPAVEEADVARRWATDWQVHLWAIMLIALIPRVIYLAQIYHWPFFLSPILDSRTQNGWAETLIKTLGIGNNEVLAKPPLYAYYLALVKALVGTGDLSLLAARLLQLVAGAVTCGLTYLVGRRVFGTAAGLLAGLFLALYSPAVFNEGELLDTALATFLATAFLLSLLVTLDRPTAGRCVGVGVVLGLLGLTRGNLLLLAPLAVALLIERLGQSDDREEMWRYAGTFVLGILIAIVPITARNVIITGGGLVPISNNGGVNFYTGNNSKADGYTPILSGVAWERTWFARLPGTTSSGLPRTVGGLTAGQQDSYWLRQGLSFWRHHTGSALALLLKKACLYWTAYDIPNNVSYAWGRSHASVLRALPLTVAVIGPLALMGIALGGWRNRQAWTLTLFIAVQWVAVIVFFVNGRYRMPAVPAMCVFASYGILEMIRRIRGRQWSVFALALVALAASVAFVNADLYGVGRRHGANRDYFLLGQSYAQKGDFANAKDAFRRATEANPTDADAWFLLGNMNTQAGDSVAAEQAYRHALEAAPDFAQAAARYVDLAIEHGEHLEEPTRLLERALDSQPTNVQGLTTLVRVDIRLGRKAEAERALKRATDAFSRWNPNDSRYGEAQAYVQQAAAEAQAVGIPLPQLLRGGEMLPGALAGIR